MMVSNIKTSENNENNNWLSTKTGYDNQVKLWFSSRWSSVTEIQ